MSRLIIVGLQWGDEGKGKIVDLLCPAFDVVVRYQGGHNAGHTVKFGDRHFSLHLIPSGILHEGTLCVLGNGMVLDPEAFFSELGRLAETGIDHRDRLFVSDRAHVILPLHAEIDRAREAEAGAGKIGTTGRGIGPAYETKAARFGLRVADLLGDPDRLRDRLRSQVRRAEPELAALARSGEGDAGPSRDAAAVVDQLAAACAGWAERLRPFVRDTEALLRGWIAAGKGVMFEGAQGALLDVDHGTYPFVTSSNSTAGGACTGTGVPPTSIDGALGVLKAYTTRVGSGPFPTERLDAVGEYLRQRGNEFGTTTGRPRRCGWLDLVAARYACALNGIDTIALTKLDVLDTQEEIPVCVAYSYQGRELRDFPASLEVLERCEPVYRVFPGWRETTVGHLTGDALPAAARAYIEFIEDQLGAPISLVSTGPRREETLVREDPALDRLVGHRLAEILAARGA